MKIHETCRLSATPTDVLQVMVDPAFQTRKAEALAALEHSVHVVRDADARMVTTRRVVQAAGVPELIRSMVEPTMVVTETERWALWDAPQTEHEGEFTIDVKGAPVSLRGIVRLRAEGVHTDLTFEGELSTSVPLFKGAIERAASAQVIGTIHTEFRLLTEQFGEVLAA